MPYAVTICSGLRSSNQVCISDGGITAAPCRMNTTLDRSRCRTSRPGGDARQHGGRGGEIGDPKSFDHVQHQCGVELFEYDEVVAGKQEEEGGEAVGVIHGRGHHDGLRLRHRRPVRQKRLAVLRRPQRRRQAENHFGDAGRPAAADAVDVRGNGGGQRACGLSRPRSASSSHRAPFVDDDGGVDHLAHPVSLPFGKSQCMGREPRRSSSTPASPAPGVASSGSQWRQGNPFRRRRPPAPGPTGWRGHRVHRKSSPARCRRARQWSRAGSSRRCSASSCSLVAEWDSVFERVGRHRGGDAGCACSRRYRSAEQCLQRPVRHAGYQAQASASAPSGNRISGWVCRSSTLTSDSSQKPRAPSNWWDDAQHLSCGVGGLEPEHQASAERTCAGSRFRSADGVLGEFVKSAHRDGRIRDGEPDGLKVRQRLAELNPGAHMFGDDLQRLLHRSQNPP